MKEILTKVVVSITSIAIISLGACMQMSAYDPLPQDLKYSEYIFDGYETYHNLKIDGNYYNITKIEGNYGKNYSNMVKVEGREEYYEVTLVYSEVRVSKFNIPSAIKFKDEEYQVLSVNLGDLGWVKDKYDFPYTEIVMPDSVVSASFYNAYLPNLKTLYVSKTVDSVTGLQDYPNLKVVIDSENPYIEMKNGAIYSKDGKNLYSLINCAKKYKVSAGTEKVFLRGNKTIQKVVLPKSMKEIGTCDFEKCSNLKTIKLNKGLKSISNYAFKGCKSLKKINIPSKIKRIRSGTFKNCKSLSKVTISNKKKAPKIETKAFKNTKDGIKFVVKNKKVAKSLTKQLKGSGARNAKIVVKG